MIAMQQFGFSVDSMTSQSFGDITQQLALPSDLDYGAPGGIRIR